jgi:hypothetical protein
VDDAGDVNADGYDDVVVGATNIVAGGSAYLFLGPATGSQAHTTADATFTGTADDDVGYAVAGPGDMDGDGYDDLAFGAPEFWSGAGSVYVFLGPASGSIDLTTDAYQWLGDASYGMTGCALASAGDQSGDGLPDLLIGASEQYVANGGNAYVVTGAW